MKRVPARMLEEVILVNERDEAVGTEEKLRAHERGALHRAISVFLFDEGGRLLLQRRAASKYHSGGVWSNTCCGHPRPGESAAEAAQRRLLEEMGIDAPLSESFVFTYRADLGKGLIEHEVDHVFVGRFQGTPSPDPREVDSWGWMPMADLIRECADHPSRYSAWLPIALRRLAA